MKMKFKEGDIVRVVQLIDTNDDTDYSKMLAAIGTITWIDEGEDYPYVVTFQSPYPDEELGFDEEELEYA
jgi:hypothetical protein